MKCHEFQSLIADYLQEAIEDPRREEFEAHFFACRKCFLGLKINETLQKKEVPIRLEEKPRLFTLKLFKPLLAMSSLLLLILFSALLVQQNRATRRLREISAFDDTPLPPGRNAKYPGRRRRPGRKIFTGHAIPAEPGVPAGTGPSRANTAGRRRQSQGPILPRHLLSGRRQARQSRRIARRHHSGHGPCLFRRSFILQGFCPAAPGAKAGGQWRNSKNWPACSAPCP